MVEAMVVERGTRPESVARPKDLRAVELTVDQRYGVRLEVQPDGSSTISFREGDRWTMPIDARALVRAQFLREGLRASE